MLFGCIGRIVTAVILLIAGAVLWQFRDAWLPRVKQYFEQKADEIQVEVPQVGQLGAGLRIVYVGAATA